VAFPVLHDRDRTAFAAYQVSVLPSVVVIDPQGRVVHALAGLSPAFRDVVTDAVLFAAGRLSGEQLARTLHPTRGPAEAPGARRAARLTELGKQLSRSGMHDLAAEKFREALTVDPRCAAARVGLGRGAIQRRRLAEAEGHFRGALEVEPGSTEAALGLAAVLAMRGGGELPQAEQHVRNVLARRPNDAEAHYLLGVILEESGKTKESMASYRKSAELLLERGGNE
jgi:Flp pilus assembly protein TadD